MRRSRGTYNIIDFSNWQDDFDGPFKNLWGGLGIFYKQGWDEE